MAMDYSTKLSSYLLILTLTLISSSLQTLGKCQICPPNSPPSAGPLPLPPGLPGIPNIPLLPPLIPKPPAKVPTLPPINIPTFPPALPIPDLPPEIMPPMHPPGKETPPPKKSPPGILPPILPPGILPPGILPPGILPPGRMTPPSPGILPPILPPGILPPGILPPGRMTPPPPRRKPNKKKPKNKSFCPPSPPPPPPKCPADTLKLGVCLDILGAKVPIGDPTIQCCPLIAGLVSVDAALCLCTAIRLNGLVLNVFLPIAVELLVSCGKTPPPGYNCS